MHITTFNVLYYFRCVQKSSLDMKNVFLSSPQKKISHTCLKRHDSEQMTEFAIFG